MIKHWEILENKWTQNSAYVLGIQGDDKDSDNIVRELSSFCAKTNIKVPSFTHIFELLNVTDDDILQKIRAKIEEIAQTSSMDNKIGSLSSTPVQISSGSLDFEKEGDPFDNIISSSAPLGGGLSSSSDGNEINLSGNETLHLEDTKTSNIADAKQVVMEPKQPVQPVQEKKEEIVEPKIAPKEEKIPENKKVENTPKKEEKVGFFKKLFSSFGKKKEKVKVEAPLGPLPIEQIAAKDKEQNKAGKEAQVENAAMHGVVVKGNSFPAEELGAQKIKDVSLNSKPLFEKDQKGQGEVLQSQVPLDDIFAAETICQFYDDQNSSEPKVARIEEPTPMPTPRVITITNNRILEENLKQAASQPKEEQQQTTSDEDANAQPKEESKENVVEKAQEVVPNQEDKVVPPAPVVSPEQEAPKAPVVPPAAPVVNEKKEKEPSLPQIPVVPVVKATEQVENKKTEQGKPVAQKGVNVAANQENNSQEKTAESDMKKDKNERTMPKISITEAEALQAKKQVKIEAEASAPKKPAASKKPAQPQQAQAPQAPKPAEKAGEVKKPIKPMVMPKVNETKIDGFDHTIQTTSIPVYKKSNWPIEMPIVPSYTLDNMDMSSNRFAHAAAMTIVESPGTMHNPFFVFGEGGCGKTHFLNAIGVEFSKKISQDKIFITNGVRFSRGVQRAIENGTINKVKEFLDSAQVLIIDDIHLTAVNETNREFISQVLNEYIAKRKQLVIASKYPPQGLSRFEELTNFKLSQGWISELKPLRPNHFLKAYVKMALDAQVDLTEAQCRGFFGRENLTLGMIAKDIKRAKVLRRRIKDSGSLSISYEQLLNYITAIAGEDTTSQLESLDLTSPLSIRRGENTNWGNFGFFFPKESADKFKWIVYATMQRAKELGIKGGFNFALKSAYSTEHIIASAFKIANVCDSKNLKAAIILGPDPKIIQPAIRDNFCDILSHMLEVMMIRCAIISYEDIKKPSSYVRVLGDVLK